ncbi:MAG: error-prone DNA polymerase [Acidimicrobiia bacterium]|nr:error-prone DNA polymerase [Acidimicrobiia bacterium]
MGWNNPPWSWAELEGVLSGRRDGRAAGSPSPNAGGDGPGWTRKRQPFEAGGVRRRDGAVPYAELHCHSSFSFLDGASFPEELCTEAARLGLDALAITDHDGLYGAVRFAEAARAVGLPTVFGAEVTLMPGTDPAVRAARAEADTREQAATGRTAQRHAPDPPGRHLVVLADGPDGYARLSRALSLGHLAGEKDARGFTLADLAATLAGHAWVLTGCRKGAVPAALHDEGPGAARVEVGRLVECFGRDRVLVEVWDHGGPGDRARNDALAELATLEGVGLVATNNVHHATPQGRTLAAVVAAVRARRSLDAAASWLPAGGGAHLRSGAEQERRFAQWPRAVALAAEVGRAAAFDLALVAPTLPPFPCPGGITEIEYLRRLAEEGGQHRYGPRPRPGSDRGSLAARAWATIDRELAIIEALGFAGYFLVVWELTRFCRERDIYCQGRGSAANSAVCYALGITNADAVSLDLLFERFLSPERDGPPDIDLDIEAHRREEVIQHVYERYGRHHTAQVANVITYRARSAVRDVAKALGHAPGQQDAWSRRIEGWGGVAATAAIADNGIPDQVLDLAAELEDAPRHLGIHSGGMVVCDRPVVDVCPVEWARMERRSVLQWDKDDCAAVGLVKFDLLGLGMLSALHRTVDLVAAHRGTRIDLAALPQEDAVYDMLGRADTVGVFQVESRAQMGTLPRLRPRQFYDLVTEIALIRPGPIQGGSVHPFIRRRRGREAVTYPHPLAERALKRTLGVPLFQEQVMQLAIDCAGFTPAEADALRQAMGSKRSTARMERLRGRMYAGMARNGITGATADEIYDKIAAFATYGFPESHSVSFAYLVYASAYLKLHEPAAFCAALLNSQPMGFWNPQSLSADARRHGVVVQRPDLHASAAQADLEADGASTGGLGVRLGFESVRGVSLDTATAIAAERDHAGPYRDVDDLARRVPALTATQMEALATAGTFACFGMERREALWTAGAAVRQRPGQLPGVVASVRAPRLPGMEPVEETVADLWATGITPDGYPTEHLRRRLDELGVTTATGLASRRDGTRVLVAGVVTHRQRPMTARGTTFANLEDETGLVNVLISRGCWQRFRRVARCPALVVSGRLERVDGAVNVVADGLTPLHLPTGDLHTSRDFR